MIFIEEVKARQIIDSRGTPTLEACIRLSTGETACACVPSGASTGVNEAVELRDGGSSYMGKGVHKAVKNVNTVIAPALKGQNPFNQREIDNILISLDGTVNKSNLGANALLGVSLAAARAASTALKIPLYRYLGGINASLLPVPMLNILNGGAHADNSVDFQEFMIAPVGASGFEDGIKMSLEIFHTLKKILKEKGYSTSVGDEGGFAPDLKSNVEALEIVSEAVLKAGYSLETVKICLDVASSEFYKDGKYYLEGENRVLTPDEMVDFLEELTENYPVISIEDGMAQDDIEGWKALTKRLSGRCQLVGDDLFTTNTKLLKQGIELNIANSILIKPNQIGTLSETLDAVSMAQKAGYGTIISHRSGETEDTFIADLAVGVNAGLIKTGSISRTERTAKYNRLLKISEELEEGARYEGISAFTCGCRRAPTGF